MPLVFEAFLDSVGFVICIAIHFPFSFIIFWLGHHWLFSSKHSFWHGNNKYSVKKKWWNKWVSQRRENRRKKGKKERKKEREGGRKEEKKKDIVSYIPYYYNLSASCRFSQAAFSLHTVLCCTQKASALTRVECLFYSQLSIASAFKASGGHLLPETLWE